VCLHVLTCLVSDYVHIVEFSVCSLHGLDVLGVVLHMQQVTDTEQPYCIVVVANCYVCWLPTQ